MGRTKPGAGAKIRLPGQGAQPPSLILCEILKVCSATADYVRFTPKSGHRATSAKATFHSRYRPSMIRVMA
jgi:hypothetical protein